MKEEKIIHAKYKKFQEIKKKFQDFNQLFGKYQYIYSSEKGKISLRELKNYFHEGDNFWEIHCLKGNLFDDVERFDTKAKAVKAIKKYLD